jgi:adenylylsulfate reductase subunit B
MGHSVRVLREEEKGTISWRLKFRDGREKHFESPIRTTAWGSIKCASEYEMPSKEAIESQELAHEPEYLKVDQGLPCVSVDQFVKYELAPSSKAKKKTKKVTAQAAE